MIINPVEKSKYLLQLDVVLEASEINNLFKKELNKTAKTSKMKGFRPGKLLLTSLRIFTVLR